MKTKQWRCFREIILTLAVNLRRYATILEAKNANMQETHTYKRPFFNDENTDLKIVEAKITTKASSVARYSRLVQALSVVNYNDVICLNEYAPAETYSSL